jgi:hypothetical protein
MVPDHNLKTADSQHPAQLEALTRQDGILAVDSISK